MIEHAVSIYRAFSMEHLIMARYMIGLIGCIIGPGVLLAIGLELKERR